MKRTFVALMGPIETRSGYGNHMRDIARSLFDMDKFDIKILPMP
jgi:hypothetical protein